MAKCSKLSHSERLHTEEIKAGCAADLCTKGGAAGVKSSRYLKPFRERGGGGGWGAYLV